MKTALKNHLRPFAALLCLCVLTTALLTACGAKTIQLKVIHGDGTEKDFTLETSAENLGDALTENEELQVEGEVGEFGLFITSVDGEAASDADHTFWLISKDGVPLSVGADSQPIVDGESYTLEVSTW